MSGHYWGMCVPLAYTSVETVAALDMSLGGSNAARLSSRIWWIFALSLERLLVILPLQETFLLH